MPACGITLKDMKCVGGTSTKLENMNNSTVYFNRNYIEGNNNNKNFNGSKVYINGDLDFKIMNSMDGVSFFVVKSILAKHFNGSGISNSNISLGGNRKLRVR